MTRTHHLNKYRNDNSVGNLFVYKRQRKSIFYNNLNVKRTTGVENFGKLSNQILLARLSEIRE